MPAATRKPDDFPRGGLAGTHCPGWTYWVSCMYWPRWPYWGCCGYGPGVAYCVNVPLWFSSSGGGCS
jgi:hypothetical protein